MKILFVAAIVLVAVPTTAAAMVTTYQAVPKTIAQSGTGHPKCTRLGFSITTHADEVIVWVAHAWHKALPNVPRGRHYVNYCGENVGLGAHKWHVAWDQAGHWRHSRVRYINVVP